jgi:inorganic pyrophosphatase
MDLSKLTPGRAPPRDLNVVVEIPLGGPPVKYELDKGSGLLFADRFLLSAMRYPGNYGFIPHTLSQDGDPCDVLVAGHIPLLSGSVVRCRPIGALLMEDEHGPDEKILAVPIDAVHAGSSAILSYTDLPPGVCAQVEHFFQHYKDLEEGKWTKISGWLDSQSAEDLVLQAIARNGG